MKTNRISNFGYPYRVQHTKKPEADKRIKENKRAQFNQQFLCSRSSPIKFSRFEPCHQTSNISPAISYLITGLMLSYAVGSVAASVSGSSDSGQNTRGQSLSPSPLRFTPKHFSTSHPLPIISRAPRSAVSPRQPTKQNKGAAFLAQSIHPTVTPSKTTSRTGKKHPAPPRPRQSSQPIHQRRSHKWKPPVENPTESHIVQHPGRNNQTLPPDIPVRVKRNIKGMKKSTTFHTDNLKTWGQDVKNRKLAKAERKKQEQKAFVSAMKFNPLTQTVLDYAVRYMEVIFEKHGLPRELIFKPLRVKIPLTAHMHAPTAHLKPKQEQPIIIHTNWTPLQIASGMNVREAEQKAGQLIALMHQFEISWTSEFNLDMKKLITGDGMHQSYRELMAQSLESGPLVDAAKKKINASVIGTMMASYSGFPEMENNIENLINQVRSVNYKGYPVIDIFVGPPIIKGTFGTIYSMRQRFPPTPIDSTAASWLQIPLYQDATREGLPLKACASLGELLFEPHTKNTYLPRTVPPQFTFSPPGNAGDVLWPQYQNKFASDINLSLFSIKEQEQLLAAGLIQNCIKAFLMMMDPVLPAWVVAGSGVLGSLPDAVSALITHDPKKAQEYVACFVTGVVIEAIGLSPYIKDKTLFRQQAHKVASEIITNPALAQEELDKFVDWTKAIEAGATPAIAGVTDTNIVTSTPENPTFTWDILNPEQKVQVTLATKLTGENLSLQKSAAVLQSWEDAIITTFHDARTPQQQFDLMSQPAYHYIATKLALINQVGSLSLPEALRLAEEEYARPINPEKLDKIYLYALTPWMQARANDTDATGDILENPSEALHSALALTTPVRMKEYIDGLQKNPLFNSTITAMLENPSESLQKEIVAFSSKQTDIFLKNFDEMALAQPGYFIRQAMLDAYIRHPDSREAITIAKSVADYKRVLGADQAAYPLARQVLIALNYYNNGSMALSGYHGRCLYDLRNLDTLDHIPGWIWFNDHQRLAVFKVIHTITGISPDRPIGGLMASIERVRSLFPDIKKLSEANYPEDENELFAILVTLDMAAHNNVGPVDPVWEKNFWRLIHERRKNNYPLGFWDVELLHRYGALRDRTVAAIRILNDIAEAKPSPTINYKMIDFAIELKRSTLPTPRIDGSTPGFVSQSIRDYLKDVMGEQPQPGSIQEWENLLSMEPTEPTNRQNPSNTRSTRATAAQNQQSGNDMINRAIRIIKWPGARKMPPIQDNDQQQEDPHAGARLLVRSGFKNIETMIQGVPSQMEQVVNENTVTTVFEEGGAYFDSDYLEIRSDFLNRMLAEVKGTNLFYSDLPDNDQLSLKVNNRYLNDDPAVKRLLPILDLMTDYSDHGAAGIFNNTFVIDEEVIDASELDIGEFFAECYNGSSCFRLVVNAAESVLGPWRITSRATPGIDPGENTLFIPKDSDLVNLPKETDLTGELPVVSLKRILLKEWMNMLLKKENGRGINSLTVNLILQQIGLEDLAYDPVDRQLSPRDQIRDFQYWMWVTKTFDAQMRYILPPEFMGGTFTNNPNQGVTIRELAQLPVLENPSPHFSLLGAISVEAPDHSIRYLENIEDILDEQHRHQGLFAQLMVTCKQRISTKKPWHIVYQNANQISENSTIYGASHWLDYDKQIAYLANTPKEVVLFLGPNGLKPLDPTTQLLIVMMEIYTGKPTLTEKERLSHRGLAVFLANIALWEVNEDATPVLAAAMIDGAAPKAVSLKLLNSHGLASRRRIDENRIVALQSVSNHG
ncbi:hypothetical protein ACVBEF_06120 [Glaciimonas sp. GG7]